MYPEEFNEDLADDSGNLQDTERQSEATWLNTGVSYSIVGVPGNVGDVSTSARQV